MSHVLASRMSSRPMGWCEENIDKMSRLRAYNKTGRSMLELVRFQKVELEEEKLNIKKQLFSKLINKEQMIFMNQ